MNRSLFGSKAIAGSAIALVALLSSGCAGSTTVHQGGSKDGKVPADPSSGTALAWTEQLVEAPAKPEDLIQLPGTEFLVISGMSADPGNDAGAAGHLYVMDKNNAALTEIWPQREHSISLDKELYGDCPGPPELDVASPHGIGLEEQDDGSSRLYVVNHGGRESVEVFLLEPDGQDLPHVTWIGCQLMPKRTFGNGVAPDPDSDGFYVTNYFDPADMNTGFRAAFAGKNTGYVLHSTPSAGWQKVPGSDMPAPNGIAVSDDGQELFVAGWGSKDIRKFSIANPGEAPDVLALGFMPDNLRWTGSGALLVTGQDIDGYETFKAFRDGTQDPKPGYQVIEIQPHTLEARQIAAGTTEGFTNPTTAIEVDERILIGSVNGNQIMQLTKKEPQNDSPALGGARIDQ